MTQHTTDNNRKQAIDEDKMTRECAIEQGYINNIQQATGNTQQAADTPAFTYLYSKELVKTFITLNNPIKAFAYIDDMCACISELEREYWSM